MVITDTIIEQLTEIYMKYEWWSSPKMSYDEALKYHSDEYDRGHIHVYEEEGKVLGYYQRKFIANNCFLMNVWVDPSLRNSYVFKKLYRHFFDTLPPYIERVAGEKQKLKGKWRSALITGGRHGFNQAK